MKKYEEDEGTEISYGSHQAILTKDFGMRDILAQSVLWC
jgi:hypothetical protein